VNGLAPRPQSPGRAGERARVKGGRGRAAALEVDLGRPEGGGEGVDFGFMNPVSEDHGLARLPLRESS
jgi:hypothetical protein